MLRPVDPRLPFQSILREKPARGLRVIAFGGSATAGLGFSPNATFSRELERILRAAHPERGVEVLNLGIVGIASKQVERLVAEAARELAPDLLVVYTGNNEFLELHAAKLARATATPLARLVSGVAELHLTRALRSLLRPQREEPSPPDAGLASEELRRAPDEILRHLSLTDAETLGVLDAYEANLEAMVASARAAGAPLLLATVASNWKWRGRSELAGDERHELLYERAVAELARGELAAAREDYRAAMNADPRLRRALDAANARVRDVARRRGVGLLDVVELLAAEAPDGIAGFEAFYDHVHFTPRGNVLVAAGIYAEMLEMGVVSASARFDLRRFRAERLARLDALRADPFAVDEWLGFGFDPSGIHARDLWKYRRLRHALDERIAADPRDLTARVYRGNARYFERDGGAAAGEDWRAALALAPGDASILANLARLAADGRAGEGLPDQPPTWSRAQR